MLPLVFGALLRIVFGGLFVLGVGSKCRVHVDGD